MTNFWKIWPTFNPTSGRTVVVVIVVVKLSDVDVIKTMQQMCDPILSSFSLSLSLFCDVSFSNAHCLNGIEKEMLIRQVRRQN